jgi:hypothetical protein
MLSYHNLDIPRLASEDVARLLLLPTPYADRRYEQKTHADWVREQLDRHTYKPGWELEIVDPVFSEPLLGIHFACRDTYHPERPEVRVGKCVPLYTLPKDPEMFTRCLAHELQAMEVHESREWFKRDGKIFDNPHVF